MKTKFAALLWFVLFAATVSAGAPTGSLVGTELGPKDSLAPVPGTGVVLLAFTGLGLSKLEFRREDDDDIGFDVAEVPPGPQLAVWRVPAGKYCLTKFSVGGRPWKQRSSDIRCFTVVEGVINNSGVFSQNGFGGYVFVGFVIKLETLAAILKEKRPDLLAPGFRWHLGRVDSQGARVAKLRRYEIDTGDYGLEAVLDAIDNPNSRLGMRQLGDAFRIGDNTAVDRAKAFSYYQRAADLGDARSAALVCQQLDLGLGVPEDQVRAVDYCRKSVERGSELGAWQLSRLYARSRGGLAPDASQQAALMGKVTDEVELARELVKNSWNFRDGKGGWPDGGEAFRLAQLWYAHPADDVDKAAAAYALAHYHANGIGTSMDGARAVELFEFSAKVHTGNEYLRIAWLYWAGKALPRDAAKAREYLERYADLEGDNVNELAWFLSIIDDPKVRNGKRAIGLQRKLLKTYKETAARVDTLAAAYAAAGKFEDAVATQTRAIEMAKTEGSWSDDALAEITARLELYKSGKGYEQKEP